MADENPPTVVPGPDDESAADSTLSAERNTTTRSHRKPRTRRKMVILIAILVLLVGGFFLWRDRPLPNGRNGQQQGQNGQPGQNGQQGQNEQQGRGGQPGSQQSMQRGQGGQQGQGQQPGQNGQGGARGGQQNAQGNGGRFGGERVGSRSGQQDGRVADGTLAFGELRGGGGSTAANLNIDTGGQKYDSTRSPSAPRIGGNPADTQRAISQGMAELNQLRQLAKSDPTVQKQIDDLAKEMQKLDPSRFPGNPAMVEALHTKVLNDVDKLELQLRRDPNEAQAGQVRRAAPPNVPAGYEDAVAEYYRRLGKGQ